MRIALSFAMIALLGTMPAVAQRGDNGQYGRPVQTPENQARFALFRAAACGMKNASASATKVLKSGLGSDEEARAVKTLRTVSRQCYEAQWPAFPATALRNVLAEIRYRSDYRLPPAPTPVGLKPPETFRIGPADGKGTPEQESAWYLGALAACVVFIDPPLSHDLVIGPSGVAEEDKRYDALKPAMAKCGAAGGVAGLNGRVFRGYLADALLVQRPVREVAGR